MRFSARGWVVGSLRLVVLGEVGGSLDRVRGVLVRACSFMCVFGLDRIRRFGLRINMSKRSFCGSYF